MSERPTLKDPVLKPGPWEAFLAEQNPQNKVQINYEGPFAQRLEINRANAERFAGIGAIDNQIVIKDLPNSRARQIDSINADGSTTQKRSVFFGQKLQSEGAARSLVTPAPGAYIVAINGERILQEEQEKDSKKPLDVRFAKKFNEELGASLISVLRKEKLSIQTVYDKARLHITVIPLMFEAVDFVDGVQVWDLSGVVVTGMVYATMNTLSELLVRRGSSPEHMGRKHNSSYQLFMPPVEIDRFARGIAFLNIKGRNLVRVQE